MDNFIPSESPVYEAASYGRRLWAVSMDMILIHSVAMSLLIFCILPSYFHDAWQNFMRLLQTNALATSMSLLPSEIIHMLWMSQKISFALTWAYFGFSEWFWRGRTLGKAILAIRNISTGTSGQIPHLWQHILRSWIKSIALSAPFPFFLLDILPLCFPKSHRRCLHDWLARTCVALYDDENSIAPSETPN
ncbi:MAG: RDD family protein [Puniceicoccales bacterium]|jgi:uncharacterized RDD family membrane protein YckC|nr:RDD family protein [Puniceicoccales bacterium]